MKICNKTYSLLAPFIACMLLMPSVASAQQTAPFDAWLAGFNEPSAISKITPIEKKLLNRIDSTQGPAFSGKLIELYLCASGINDDALLAEYLIRFEKIVEDARTELSQSKNRNLNSYNKAEYLLHFLHTKIFLTAITGSGAGFNIGIRETLDTGAFNCYKSALIYNAFLEYFGYRTSLVLVPEHIYSIVYIDALAVDVETTNRWGFDPYGKGGAAFTRAFDDPRIIFDKKYYRNMKPAGNIDIVSQIFSNRLSMYSGDRRYSGETVAFDMERAAALGLMGVYVNPKDDITAENCLTIFSRIFKSSLEKKPADMETTADHFLRTASRFASHSEYNNSINILEVSIINIVQTLRRNALAEKDAETKIVSIVTRDFYFYEKYLKNNLQLYNSGYNNTTFDFLHFLIKQNPSPDTASIDSISRTMQKYFNDARIKNHPRSAAFHRYGSETLAVLISNTGAAAYNAGEKDKAEKIFSKGIESARNAEMYDAHIFLPLEKNLLLLYRSKEKNAP